MANELQPLSLLFQNRLFRIPDYQRGYAWLQQQLVDELDGALLITPTVAHVAPALAALEVDDERFASTNLATLRLTMPGSLLDMPGVTLPSGCDALACLPGCCSAPDGEDARLLRAALSVEFQLTI